MAVVTASNRQGNKQDVQVASKSGSKAGSSTQKAVPPMPRASMAQGKLSTLPEEITSKDKEVAVFAKGEDVGKTESE